MDVDIESHFKVYRNFYLKNKTNDEIKTFFKSFKYIREIISLIDEEDTNFEKSLRILYFNVFMNSALHLSQISGDPSLNGALEGLMNKPKENL